MGDQKDNVKVAIRIRPFNDKERQEGGKPGIVIQEAYKTIAIEIKNEKKAFTFDFVASEDITQQEIFEKIGKPIAKSCLSGYNGTIFAYGQTGAGKTFTILGNNIESISYPNLQQDFGCHGLLPRCFEYLFSSIQEETSSNDRKYLIKCSYLEIYQEQVNDLLDPNPQNLQLREDIKHGVYVDGLIEETVSNVNETYNILKIGTQNRHVGCTSMNKESSRSHSVFTLVIESKENRDGITNFKTSRFHLIDLAGSERQKATDCAGERLKEAGMINKSLSALGNVINSLVDISEGKSRHVHYRDSKLTFLLKDSLGGNSKTYIVANISPSITVLGETLSTLKFAQRAKQIKNIAVVNEDTSGAVAMLRYEVKRLKDELSATREQNICSKCSETTLPPGEENDLLNILENTMKIKQENEHKLTKQISDKENYIQVLKTSISKLENKISHDKMILKFRDATISSLQSGTPDYDNEIIDLKKEIEILKENNESNPQAAKLFVENQRLVAELQHLQQEKALESTIGSRILELEEINSKLVSTLNTCAKEKQKIEVEFMELSQENKILNQNKTELETFIEKLQGKIGDLEISNLSLQTENNLIETVSNNSRNSSDELLIEDQEIVSAQKIDEIIMNVSEQQISLQNEYLNKINYECIVEELQQKNQELQEKYDSLVLKSNTQIDFKTAYNEEVAKMSEELNYLEIQYQNKENESEANKKELIDLLNQNTTLLANFQEIQYLLTTTTEKNAYLEKEIEYSETRIKKQESLLKVHKTTEDQLEKLIKTNEFLTNEKNKIQGVNNTLEEKIQTQDQEMKNLLEKNINLKAKVKEHKASLNTFNEKVSYYRNEYLSISQQIEDTKTEVEELLNKLKIERGRKESLEECLENLKLEYAKFKVDQETKYIQANEEIKHLELELTKEKRSNSVKKDVESVMKTLEQDLKIARNSADTFQELNLSLTQKNAELQNSITKIQSNHVPIYIIEQLKSQLLESQQELSIEKSDHKQRLEALKSTKAQMNLTKTEILSLRKTIDDKNNLIQELNIEISKLKQAGDSETSAENKFLRTALMNKERELKELKEKGQEYYSQADEVLENMRKKCMGLQSEVNNLKDELRTSSNMHYLSDIKKSKLNLRENIENINKNNTKTNEELIMLKSMNHKLTEELSKNVNLVEILQKKHLDTQKKYSEVCNFKKQCQEEIENLTNGLTKITDFVFSLPSVKFNPEEDSIVESTIRAISYLYDSYKRGIKHY